MTVPAHIEWLDIGLIAAGSHLDQTTLIVTDGIDTIALAFCEGGDWYLGEATNEYRTVLDFHPEFWLPRDYPQNPFHTPFADRPTLAQQNSQGRADCSEEAA